ncbi:MAG: hypothetical protein R2850_02550 [Bacteroidia bacterium]
MQDLSHSGSGNRFLNFEGWGQRNFDSFDELPFFILGESAGGTIALNYAAMKPDTGLLSIYMESLIRDLYILNRGSRMRICRK